MKEGNSDASFPKVSKKIVNLKKKKTDCFDPSNLGFAVEKEKRYIKVVVEGA